MGLGSCGGQRTALPTIRDQRIAHQTIVWVRFTGVLAINVHYSDPQSRPQTGPLAQFGARIFADWRPPNFAPMSIVLEQKQTKETKRDNSSFGFIAAFRNSRLRLFPASTLAAGRELGASMAGFHFEHFQLAGFDDGNGLRAFDGGESHQKIFNGFAAFQGVNQILQGDTGAHKNGRAAHNFGVGVDDAVQIFRCHDMAKIRLPARLSPAKMDGRRTEFFIGRGVALRRPDGAARRPYPGK